MISVIKIILIASISLIALVWLIARCMDGNSPIDYISKTARSRKIGSCVECFHCSKTTVHNGMDIKPYYVCDLVRHEITGHPTVCEKVRGTRACDFLEKGIENED